MEFDKPILGEDATALHLSTSPEHRETMLCMAEQARRGVWIYTRDLDPAVYDSAELMEALSRMVRQSRHAGVYVLVQDTRRAVQQGHALVRLAQKLSSKVQIRVPAEEDRDYLEAFCVVDETGYIRRPAGDLYSAEASFHNPFQARHLLQYFKEVWERSDTDPQLRYLFL